MISQPILSPRPDIEYPDSDGEPMAENTVQYNYLVTIKEGLESMFRDDPYVFVAGDLFWYPVEGEPNIKTAPDVLVAQGRPKGDRRSYMQWDEGGIAPQVVFEIQSSSNRPGELSRKFNFYDLYGVQEYYLYDLDSNVLSGWLREGTALNPIKSMAGWKSPLLKVRFELEEGKLNLYRPDGERFLLVQEALERWAKDKRERKIAERRADKEASRADKEASRAKDAARQAEEARLRADKEASRAESADRKAEEACLRAERLEAQLRALGIKPDA